MRSSTVILLIILAVFAFFGLAVIGVVILALLVARTQNGPPAAKPDPVVLTATDGLCRVTLPPGWSVRPELKKEDASIKVGDPTRETYLEVFTEAKADYADDLTYRGHSDLTRAQLMKNIDQPLIVSGPKELVINGRRAVQYEIHGVAKTARIKLAYLHTTVDGEKSFHQLVAWTLQSRLAGNRQTLDDAINSFTDVP